MTKTKAEHMEEIGRPLKANELRPETIVVIQPPGRDIYFTMWVRELEATCVEFFSGELNCSILNFIQPDGTIIDGRGSVVKVFEYLGKP